MLRNNAKVDPSAPVDQLGPSDVVNVLAAVFTVMLALVIEADSRLVVAHVDVRILNTVAHQYLSAWRWQSVVDQDEPYPSLLM